MASLAILTLSSCLKDKFDVISSDGSTPVVEFKNPGFISPETPEGATSFSAYIFAYENGTAVEKSYTVQLTGPDPAKSDITLNIGINTAAVTTVNSEKSVASTFVPFTVMPTTLYTILTPTVTIPAGQRSATVRVRYNTTLFDYAFKYGLPLAITSANNVGISKNFGSIILNIAAKNAYDGVYTYKSNATQSLRPNANDVGAELVTIDKTTVTTPLVNFYTAASNTLYYTIDPATNKVTVSGGGIGAITTDPSSNYNPTTKVLFVKWSTATRVFEETWTYTGPRD